MTTAITRRQALSLAAKIQPGTFPILHALTVEGVIRWYSQELGFARVDFWGLCGTAARLDFEKYPEEHCQKAPALLAEIHAETEMVHAICSHGYGLCCDVEP